MLEAGVQWLEKHKNADFQVLESPDVFGVIKLKGSDVEALEKVVLDAANGDTTGAMHHTVMNRLYWIAQNGWEKYCQELRQKEEEA